MLADRFVIETYFSRSAIFENLFFYLKIRDVKAHFKYFFHLYNLVFVSGFIPRPTITNIHSFYIIVNTFIENY